MPQPLGKVRSNAVGIRMGNVADHPLQRHPDLALLAMEAIASWANVESFMLNLFMELFGGPHDKAGTVFLALDSHGTRSAAILAVADTTLSKEHNVLLRAILALIKTNQRARDKIAHWIWGDTPDLPDALLLANPKHLVSIFTLPRPGVSIGVNEIYEQLYAVTFVYRAQDFRELIRANERLADFGMRLRFILSNHPANSGNQLYDQLCAEPEIRDKLSHPA